jgi:uncharacterized protein (DUF58 family)
VQRGRPAFAQLRVHNTGQRRQTGFTATDRVESAVQVLTVRPLSPGAEAVYHYDLPTERRGRHQVGPLALHRVDPLGLGRSRLTAGETATLWVHPRVHPMRVMTGGYPRHHHEGSGTDNALNGSLDVRDVREYVVGDEVRHLHWKATARTGQLMVRDFVDPAQPRLTVLLDTRRSPTGQTLFEDAVDLAASLTVSAATAEHRCRLLTTGGVDVAAGTGAGAARRILDELCTLRRDADPRELLVPTALTESAGGGLAVVLTGVAAADRAALATLRRFSSVVVIVLGDSTETAVPGATLLRASSADEAVRRWNAAATG